MTRFAQRPAPDFNIRVKALIKIEPTNSIDMTNSNSGGAPSGPVLALNRYVSPFKLLNIPAAHNIARMIRTSSRLLAVALFVFISFPLTRLRCWEWRSREWLAMHSNHVSAPRSFTLLGMAPFGMGPLLDQARASSLRQLHASQIIPSMATTSSEAKTA